jgi:hypothetical protein
LNRLERKVKEELEAEGWEVFHAGFPDFICFKGHELRFVEVKGKGDKVSPIQSSVFNRLTRVGLFVEIKRRGKPSKLLGPYLFEKFPETEYKRRALTHEEFESDMKKWQATFLLLEPIKNPTLADVRACYEENHAHFPAHFRFCPICGRRLYR